MLDMKYLFYNSAFSPFHKIRSSGEKTSFSLRRVSVTSFKAIKHKGTGCQAGSLFLVFQSVRGLEPFLRIFNQRRL